MEEENQQQVKEEPQQVQRVMKERQGEAAKAQ